MNRSERRPRTLLALGAAMALAFPVGVILGACDTEELLEADTPGRVAEEDLNDPALAETLAQSVVGDVECAWDRYVGAAAHHSDEWMQSSGNSTMKRWGLRDIPPTFDNYATGTCDGGGYGLFTPMHIARVQAQTNFSLIQGFGDADVPNKTALLAMIRAYGAFTLIAFGEGFCGTPLDGESAVLGTAELLQRAETWFSEAIQLAQDAGETDLMNMALVGRARARLGLEDYAGAIDDADDVPPGFRFDATRAVSPTRRQNSHYENINGTAAESEAEKHATIAPSYRDVEWKGVDDPRVNAEWDGTLGFDFTTPHWRHDKVNSRSDPVMMASYREAQMIIAEAAAMTNDLATARQILQDFHTAAGIPSVDATDLPTQDDVIAHVIEERRREFFSEGGHRLRDHLRWRGTQFEVPFLGEPGSDHPNGVDQYGQPYEDTTCFPVPDVEAGAG